MRGAARKLRARLPVRAPGPVAVYARVLDGDHLWLAVEGVAPDTGFLVDVPGGEPVRLEPEETRALSRGVEGVELRASLTDLPLPPVGPGESLRARLLAGHPGGVAVTLVEAPAEDVTMTPRASRGWWQHTVRQGDAGELLLERTGHAPWSEVRSLAADDHHLRAQLDLPAAPGSAGRAQQQPQAALLGPAGHELARLPLPVLAEDRPDGGSSSGSNSRPENVPVELTVPADIPVPAGTAGRVMLVVGDSPGPTVPVRRRRHELTYPDASVALPGIADARTEKPLLRWRWMPDGTLAVQRPRDDSAGSPSGGPS